MTSSTLMIVGSLNRLAPYFRAARGIGLSVYAFDEMTAEATLVGATGAIDNPSFLSVHGSGQYIYTTSEVSHWAEGLVSACALAPPATRLRAINMQPSLGSIAAHNSIDGTGRFLLVANYSMAAEDEGPNQAVAVFPIRGDGGLAPAVSSVAHVGHGPDPDRQERSHPHCVLTSPDNRFVLVADLGLDAIFSYAFDEATGHLGAATRIALPPGSGPRHLVFHPGGRLVFVSCELNSTVLSFHYDAPGGTLRALDGAPTLPAGETIENYCSDLQVHPNGRVLYVANRGHDSIAMVSIEPETGTLALLTTRACGGTTPRNLAIDPSGGFLAVANQNSDTIVFFPIDAETGAMGEALPALAQGTPMCIKFVRI
ncbi:lactonase family protein [Acidisoma cladoniae]|jgi:6-phosphogluconolactonase|uniref:lactonase family protein n=1 Tax=Acidisoma cladoniae TaxID=3040935 RepID=UPI00254B7C2E|nr:lactonase family protein [Acidisoma sp. PAMC 29798]